MSSPSSISYDFTGTPVNHVLIKEDMQPVDALLTHEQLSFVSQFWISYSINVQAAVPPKSLPR